MTVKSQEKVVSCMSVDDEGSHQHVELKAKKTQQTSG
jgi:hypothetical protein